MSLSPASSIVIDLLLMSDAVAEGNVSDVRRLARRIQRTAEPTRFVRVARHARHIEEIASDGVKEEELTSAMRKLLRESEHEIAGFGHILYS